MGLVVSLSASAMAHQISHKISGATLKNNSVTGKQVKESTLGVVPKATTATAADTLPALAWHLITPAEFSGGWTNYDGAGRRPAADAVDAVDAQGIVHLRGAIWKGAPGDTAFTLPASATPDSTTEIPVTVEGATATLRYGCWLLTEMTSPVTYDA